MTRGGAALWYRDFAAGELDILELLAPEEYLPQLEERRARGARPEAAARRALRPRAGRLGRERLGDVTVVHPG